MSDFLKNPPPLEGLAVRNLFDLDFYDLPMGGFILEHHPDDYVTMVSMNRHKDFPIADVIDQGDYVHQLSGTQSLKSQPSDIYYARGMDAYGDRIFPEAYIDHWKALELSPFTVDRVGTQYDTRFHGKWVNSMNWELYDLPIRQHLIHVEVEKSMTHDERIEFYNCADAKLVSKLKRIAEIPSIRFSDFGHRRRWSFPWHDHVIRRCKEITSKQFVGTSNVYMAHKHDLLPMGTIAHQEFIVPVALESDNGPEAMRRALYDVLLKWAELYPYGLRILLPDTYGSTPFFRDMPPDIARRVAAAYRGSRGDSGDLIEEGERYIAWLKKFGVDPREKLYIPSDGLDVDEIIRIHNALYGRIELSYGIGTNLTCDFRGCHPRGHEEAIVRGKRLGITWEDLVTPHSLICKPLFANGKPCVKLSNNPNKATGPAAEVERYVRIFGSEGRGTQKVFV